MTKEERIDKIMNTIGGMLADCEVSYHYEQEGGEEEDTKADEERLKEYIRGVLEEYVCNNKN